jgi:hypothetical protein
MHTCTEYINNGGLAVKPFAQISLYTLATTLFASTPTQAALLDFVIEPPHPGGSISFDGSNTLVASGLSVARVIGVDTPANDTVTAQCIDCTLAFNSGAFDSYSANLWDFGPGGSITIFGGVDLTGDSDTNDVADIASGSLLLTGSFNAARVLGLNGGTYSFQIAGGDFLDSKHVDLLSFYGLPIASSYQGNLNLSFLAQLNPDSNPLTADFASIANGIGSGDIINQPIVPIPTTVWLLASGLLGMITVARRRDHA